MNKVVIRAIKAIREGKVKDRDHLTRGLDKYDVPESERAPAFAALKEYYTPKKSKPSMYKEWKAPESYGRDIDRDVIEEGLAAMRERLGIKRS